MLVFYTCRSTAATVTLQVTVEPCSLQVRQCCIQPALKTPGYHLHVPSSTELFPIILFSSFWF